MFLQVDGAMIWDMKSIAAVGILLLRVTSLPSVGPYSEFLGKDRAVEGHEEQYCTVRKKKLDDTRDSTAIDAAARL